MSIMRCPKCQQQYTVSNVCSDYVHTCTGDEALAQEDVLVLGTYTDETTGSVVTIKSDFTRTAGRVNLLQGNEANQRTSAKLPEFTIVGNKKEIYRQRQREIYIDGIEHYGQGA